QVPVTAHGAGQQVGAEAGAGVTQLAARGGATEAERFDALCLHLRADGIGQEGIVGEDGGLPGAPQRRRLLAEPVARAAGQQLRVRRRGGRGLRGEACETREPLLVWQDPYMVRGGIGATAARLGDTGVVIAALERRG